jgi:hypothetical protein
MPAAHLSSQLTSTHGQKQGGGKKKPHCMKGNHFQPGANLLKGLVLHQCYFSFQSIVIKCPNTLQEEGKREINDN